jgi:hypothetical protein
VEKENTPMIALLVMTDGRDHIHRTIASAMHYLDGPITERWIHDDSGDPDNVEMLRAVYEPIGFQVIATPGRSGFGGAIRSAWSTLLELSEAPFVFHLEDDFVFRRQVRAGHMMGILERFPHLVNLALRRQPWNDDERAAGGIVEQHPDAYHDRSHFPLYAEWLEHRLFFTTNPGLYRRSLMEREWPDGANSEGRFSHALLEDPDVRFGYYGARDSGEWVEHIGVERVGVGY